MSPSGPIVEVTLAKGREVLDQLEVVHALDPHALDRGPAPYLAGPDDARAEALVASVDARPDALWMIRGGYGAIRTLEHLGARDTGGEGLFGRAPVALWAFSDGTALLAAWDRAGWPAWHAPPVTQLPRLDEASLARVRAAWHAGHVAGFDGLRTLAPGPTIRAPLAGGNLCVLASLVGTPYQADVQGRIVVLEDTNEPAYKVDRLLTQLRVSGALEGAVGLAVGEFSNLPDAEHAAVMDVLARELPRFGIPAVSGLPVGHDQANAPLPFGPATGWDGVMTTGPAVGADASLAFLRR